MDANALPADTAVRSSEIGSESASLQAIPQSLESLLAQHGTDPGADSRTRIRPALSAVIVGDLHVGLGMGLALTASIVIGPMPHMVWNAFGFGLGAAAAVLALGRPSRVQGRVDLVLSTLLCGLLAVLGGVGMPAVLATGPCALVMGGTLLAGLLLACAGLHADRGLVARLARVLLPTAPLAAALAVR